MHQRMNYISASPEVFKAMLDVEKTLHASFDGKLLHMVKLRASQINGCAYCVDMHWKDARNAGESEERLYMLNAWRESGLYSDPERAALAWTEALTLVNTTHAPDEDYAALKSHYSEKQIADLSWAIATINAWNRIAIGFRATPGVYQAPKRREATAT
jgi:AhpD family alkylhydroperoxidase